jgi:glucose/arabinose dehydrogenase
MRPSHRRRPTFERLDARLVPVTLPPGFAAVDVVAEGLAAPSAMAVTPDGRVFVAEQAGAIRVVRDDALQPTPFATIPVDATGERGLVGIALDPAFASNGFVYVYRTTPPGDGPTRNQVLRLTAVGDVADPAATRLVFELPPVPAGRTNHNGGALAFGPDGTLYVGVGDQATPSAAPRLRVLRGKVLRLNPDGSIPRDNPFFARLRGPARAVYARGLRNPFTMAVDPASGRILVNDVGQSDWEEVNRLARGANYGWPGVEGPARVPGVRAPIHAYRHFGRGGPAWQQGCGVVGGAFAPRGGGWPTTLQGDYLFSDLCRDQIRALDLATRRVRLMATGLPGAAVDLDVAADGALYRLARVGESGLLTRIAPAPPA